VAKGKQNVKKPKDAGRVSKLNAWFRAYIDQANPQTFLNKTESARVAGYKSKSEEGLRHMGCQAFTKLSVKIDKWLDESSLSEQALKVKMLSLMEGKQTIFQKVKGAVKQENLPPGWRIVTTGGTVKMGEDGDVFGDGDTLLACDVEFPELQRRTLDMAIKVRGMYAPEKREHTGKDGGPMEVIHSADPMGLLALKNAIAGTQK